MLIFNGARVLGAIVRSLHCAAELMQENKSAIRNCCTGKSVRSAAELTKVDETEIKLCCENRLSISGQYCFRYNVDPSIADDDAFTN